MFVPPWRLAANTPAGDAWAAIARFFPRTRVAGIEGLAVGQPVLFHDPSDGKSSMLVGLGMATASGFGRHQDIVVVSRVRTHLRRVIENLPAQVLLEVWADDIPATCVVRFWCRYHATLDREKA